MRHDSVTVGHPGGKPDWKGIGYLTSILSVFFLGAIAWPKPDDPRWHVAVLVACIATSILGMGFRYKAHLDQLRELKKTEAKADGQRPRTRE
jgi:hypothetical protein